MKKLLLIPLLFVLLLFPFAACSTETTEEEPEIDWNDYFQVTYEHKDAIQCESMEELLEYMKNGTVLYEQEIYTVKNTSNYTLKSIYCIFTLKVNYKTAFEFDKWVCSSLKQGESDTAVLAPEYDFDRYCEEYGYEVTEGAIYEAILNRIEFKIAT